VNELVGLPAGFSATKGELEFVVDANEPIAAGE
jgi:hypothetical protein